MLKVNKIYHGDCLKLLNDVDSDIVDLTVTSPPYDSLRDYNGYEFNFEPIANEIFRVTKPGGVCVWIVGDATIKGSETLTSFKQALYFKEIGFNVHDTMIWQKPNFANPSINRYHQIFEYMFIFSKGKPKTFNPIKDKKNKYVGKSTVGKNTARKANGEMVERKKKPIKEFGMRVNIWQNNTVGQENMCKKLPHPAMFPESLIKDHIISWSNPNDLVMDPFSGSGTTAKVAMLNNRNYIGMEISKEYVEISEKIINEFEGLLSILK